MVEIERSALPHISVIIITYNGSAYIKRLLDSLHDQSYPQDKFETIVVDNASTDNTPDIIRENYPGVKLIALTQNKGFAAGNNYALQYAAADYIAFLNQDTLCHRDWLLGLVRCMLKHSEAGACTSNMIFADLDSAHTLDLHKPVGVLCYYDLTLFGYANYRCVKDKDIIPTKIISGCSFIIRREIISSMGYLFDEALWMYVEDTDLSLRIHNLGYKTTAVKDSVVYHFHKNDFSLRKNRISIASNALRNRAYVFYKNMSAAEFAVFYPLLLIGGIFKIFNFHMTILQKIMYFIPFAIFSLYCMANATLTLHKYKTKKYAILKQRKFGKLRILKLLLSKDL